MFLYFWKALAYTVKETATDFATITGAVIYRFVAEFGYFERGLVIVLFYLTFWIVGNMGFFKNTVQGLFFSFKDLLEFIPNIFWNLFCFK